MIDCARLMVASCLKNVNNPERPRQTSSAEDGMSERGLFFSRPFRGEPGRGLSHDSRCVCAYGGCEGGEDGDDNVNHPLDDSFL